VSVIEPTWPTASPRPLLVLLHFATGSNESFFNNRHFLDGVVRLGKETPVIAFPDGDDSWWHDRRSGKWDRYVVEEVIPVWNDYGNSGPATPPSSPCAAATPS